MMNRLIEESIEVLILHSLVNAKLRSAICKLKILVTYKVLAVLALMQGLLVIRFLSRLDML